MRDRSLGSTIRLKFTTTDSNGAAIAPSAAFVASDFRIYKDGSAAEKTTTNGITVTSPFDSVTGRHMIEIDTSNSTGDAGFWTSGSAYFVELNTAKTVNGQPVTALEIGSFSIDLQTAQADLRKILGTTLTETAAGYIAAAFKKVFDVASAVFTAASVNQTGDAFARIGSNGAGLTALGDTRLANLDAAVSSRSTFAGLGANAPAGWLNAAAFAAGSLNGKGDWSTADALSTASSTLQSMITALNNLSAKANWFGSLLLEVPDSGTRAYQFELVVRDDEDKLTNLDGNPTITLTNTAGTDRSSLITTGIANPSTGRYTLTISVGTSTTNEALKLTATGTISGETRYAVITPQVVDYDTATLINSIYTRIGAPSGASIAADIAATKTVVDTVAADTTTLKSRITANLFSGITYMKNWLALIMGKAADNTTKTEVNATTAGATYDQTTDSLEAQQEAGGGGGGGSGDASQATLLQVQDTVNDILSLVSSATITTTGYARLDANGVLLLKRGDTSAITFTSTTSNVVPDTSDSTTKVFFGVRDAAGRNFVTIEGTKLVNTGLQSYRFSPTAAQAKLIPKGKHYFDVMVMYGYTAGTAPAEGKPGTPATYTSLRTFVSGRCDVDDLMIEPSEVY